MTTKEQIEAVERGIYESFGVIRGEFTDEDTGQDWYDWWMWVLRDMEWDQRPLRGIRIEPNHRGELMAHVEDMPSNPWLGIHHDGLRMGSRVTLADIGWVDDDAQ